MTHTLLSELQSLMDRQRQALASAQSAVDKFVKEIGQGLVLIVEDDVDTANLYSLMLERMGYHVDIARTGEAAVQNARTRNYDAIVMDLMLPGIDGIEATNRIQKQTDSIVVVVTGHPSEWERANGLQGNVQCLTKPVNAKALVGAINGRKR